MLKLYTKVQIKTLIIGFFALAIYIVIIFLLFLLNSYYILIILIIFLIYSHPLVSHIVSSFYSNDIFYFYCSQKLQ